MVGTPDSYVLYSGSRATCDTHRASLAALAANSDHLGEDAGLAATYDLAMLDLYFAGMTGFLYAAALVTADGVSAKAFLPYAQRMVGLPEPIIAGLAAEVDAAEHPGDDDNLVMELAVADHIVAASAERGIDTGPPELTRSLLRRGVEQGHGWDTFSRLIDLLHRPAA